MLGICEICVCWHSIYIFKLACFCISGGYLSHQNFTFPSLSYQIPCFLYFCPVLPFVLSVNLFFLPTSVLGHLLFISLLLLADIFIIAVLILSSLIQFLNCNFSLLFLLDSHSFALTVIWPIHSSVLFLSSLINIQCCIDNVVSLC